MTSAPQLLTEDRPDFERLLDTALHGAEYAVGPGRSQRLNPEQLRTMALSAIAAIAACAAIEYERYVRLRTELRRPSSASGAPGAAGAAGAAGAGDAAGSSGDPGDNGSPTGGGGDGMRFAGAMSQMAETPSAGLAATAAVLVPVLSGTAAAIFLLVGYLLRVVQPDAAIAPSLRQAGWIFAVLAVGAVLIAMAALLITAMRNSATSIRAAANRELAEEVVKAREAWHEALLERGILPFLEEALAGNGDGSAYPVARPDSVGRTPRLGYSPPAFTSPDDGRGDSGEESPGYSSPDFTSPDYGGPEHDPD